jgi:hypothetical protein
MKKDRAENEAIHGALGTMSCVGKESGSLESSVYLWVLLYRQSVES